MRHIIVDRIVGLLTATWVAVVVVFAWAVTRSAPIPAATVAARAPEPAPDSAALFDRHCARCHTVAEAAEGLRDAPDRDAEGRALTEFLRRHHGPTPEGNAQIVRYLEQSLAR